MTGPAKAIDEIEDRLHDLIDALRGADAPELAAALESYGRDFTVPARVRRSVNGIRDQLEGWRKDPTGLPDSPKVMIAANRLEDACRQGLESGVISAAAPSLAWQWRRKLIIAFVTLLSGGLLLLIPIALIEAGVDITHPGAESMLNAVRLPRGEENSLAVQVFTPPLMLKAVTGLEIGPVGGCRQRLRGDATCSKVEPRLWPEGPLPTYELRLPRQAYGLLFSISDVHMDPWGVGNARVLLAATDETPEGHYEIPLTATYLGYTPQRCELWQRVRRHCPPPRVGEGERHAGQTVPIVVVEVVPGDPARRLGEKRLAEAKADEAHRKAEERAGQIAAALNEIRSALLDTEKILGRHRYGEARTRVQKLTGLFAPLDVLVATQADLDLIPPEVERVRDRFEALRERITALETRVFEQTFASVTADKNRRVPESQLLQRIASQYGLTSDDVESIYTEHAAEIERRIAAQQQARLDQIKAAQEALEKRCGPLPKSAWHAVEAYMHALTLAPHVEIALGECMTPRLSERDCWEVRCDYKLVVEVAVERPKTVTSHAANFYLLDGKVVRHKDD